MNYNEFHNHKWAVSLSRARRYLQEGKLETFYRGEDLENGDIYPGMKVMAAYWVSVEHEMKMRFNTLLEGSGHPAWREDSEILEKTERYFNLFLEDMRALVEKHSIVEPSQIDQLVAAGVDTPSDWAEQMHAWQEQSEQALQDGVFPPPLLESWFNSCLRSLIHYNRNLIACGVLSAALYQREGEESLRRAVDLTAEDFMWDISREFYGKVLPQAGFEDVGDMMELGMRGMFSDQYYQSGEEKQVGDMIVKQSILKNCELAGIFQQIAEWEGLPKTALGYGICRYCEVHGAATMMITIPPMYSPAYGRIQSFGMDDRECIFELALTPADDMDRLMMVQEKIFGSTES